MRCRSINAIWIVILLTSLIFTPATAAPPARVVQTEILPELELFSGVLALSTRADFYGPRRGGHEYYKELKAFLEPFKEHQAFRVSEELMDRGIGGSLLTAFILHLGPLPDLALQHEYDPVLVRVAGGRELLEKFRLALRDLAVESRFLEFVEAHRADYARWCAENRFDASSTITWLESFFGESNRDYRLILAPAMFLGAYGPSVKTAEGRIIVHMVLLESGNTIDQPEFNLGNMKESALHEWGHSFSDPAVLAYPEKLEQFAEPLAPAIEKYKTAYGGHIPTLMREQVLRAVAAVAAHDLQGPERMERVINYETGNAWVLTRPAVNLILEYQQNRDKYPDFASFMPVLLDRLAAGDEAPEKPVPVETAPAEPAPASGGLPWLLIIAGSTGVAVVAGAVGYRRRWKAGA